MQFSVRNLITLTTTVAVLVWLHMETGFPHWETVWEVLCIPTLDEAASVEREYINAQSSIVVSLSYFLGVALWLSSIFIPPLISLFMMIGSADNNLSKWQKHLMFWVGNITFCSYWIIVWGTHLWAMNKITRAYNTMASPTWECCCWLTTNFKFIVAAIVLLIIWLPYFKKRGSK